jgi:hypothetical protein
MVANTTASKKAKGTRLEQQVAAMYRHYDIDPRATRMPMSGAMSHFKGDIWKPNDYEYLDECKNTEKVKLWEFWEQATGQTDAPRIPILHISGNYRPILTVMSAETYFNLRKEIRDLTQELLKSQGL